jgi:SWI/SNF-related matrix-associated actin-dependent regulator of chromatin subfamily D
MSLSCEYPVEICADTTPFNILPERYLAPPNPVVIYYTVNLPVSPPERPAAWDIELKVENATRDA